MRLKFIANIRLNAYIRSIAKVTGKMVDFLCHSSKYLIPPVMLHLDKSQIKLKMVFAAISSLELPNPN